MPHAPCPDQHPPDTPRGSFLGGLCQGCLCHPAAPWSRLAGSPRSPGSRLPGSALGPFVTLRCPRPAPRGLACRGRGRDRLSVPAPLSFSPPTACRLPRRPPLPPPPDTPPATLSPPRGHAWLGGRRAPDPPVPLNASRHPPPAAPGARGPRPPPPARRCAALCGGARGAAGGRPRPLHFFQECAPHAPRSMPRSTPPRYPPGVFPGGPLSGLPVSPSGPLVTLGWVTPEPRVTFAGVSPGALRHAPLPAPRPPGACLPRPGARPPLCPRPPVILPSNGVQAPAPPPAPAPTRHAPCDPVPSSRSRMAGRAPRPRPPRSPERQPPSTARSPRSPRTPTPPARPPLRRAVRGG